MNLTESELESFKKKQQELDLTDEQCNKVIEYIKFGFTFSDSETEFEGYILDFIDNKK